MGSFLDTFKGKIRIVETKGTKIRRKGDGDERLSGK